MEQTPGLIDMKQASMKTPELTTLERTQDKPLDNFKTLMTNLTNTHGQSSPNVAAGSSKD